MKGEQISKSKSNDLLGCPFCGGEAELKQTGRNKITIKCKSCLVKMEQKVLRQSLEWLEKKMIESWNKRIMENHKQEAVKIVREYARGIRKSTFDGTLCDQIADNIERI